MFIFERELKSAIKYINTVNRFFSRFIVNTEKYIILKKNNKFHNFPGLAQTISAKVGVQSITVLRPHTPGISEQINHYGILYGPYGRMVSEKKTY